MLYDFFGSEGVTGVVGVVSSSLVLGIEGISKDSRGGFGVNSSLSSISFVEYFSTSIVLEYETSLLISSILSNKSSSLEADNIFSMLSKPIAGLE